MLYSDGKKGNITDTASIKNISNWEDFVSYIFGENKMGRRKLNTECDESIRKFADLFAKEFAPHSTSSAINLTGILPFAWSIGLRHEIMTQLAESDNQNKFPISLEKAGYEKTLLSKSSSADMFEVSPTVILEDAARRGFLLLCEEDPEKYDENNIKEIDLKKLLDLS